MTKCLNCGSSSTGGYLCQRCLDCKGKRCRQSTEDKRLCLGCALRDVAIGPPSPRAGKPRGLSLAEELALAETRQTVMGCQQGMPHAKDDERPLSFNVFAADVSRDLRETLWNWLDEIEPQLAGGESLLQTARMLLQRLNRVGQHEHADMIYEEITYAVRRAWKAIDRPENRSRVEVADCVNVGCTGSLWAFFPTADYDPKDPSTHAAMTCTDCQESYPAEQWLRVGTRIRQRQVAS